MRTAILAIAAWAAIGQAGADSGEQGVAQPAWEFALTAYPTTVRGGDSYTSAIATADRGPLHLEARVDYEVVGARSAFVGWTFSGGDTVAWEITPLLGGAWGDIQAFVPGLEASVSRGRFDFYLEGEYVRDSNARDDSYLYAWTELGFTPLEWLRLGAVAQRTKAYGGEREIQRGPFLQVTWGSATIGGFWFNPGSDDQVFVASIGVAF